MKVKNVPECLKKLRQWVCWKKVTRKDDKITKVPYRVDGKQASVMKPADWATFEDAMLAYIEGDFDGVGFVFTPVDGFAGVDFDNVIDEDGVIDESVLRAVEAFDSYTEFSPSGRGLHIIIEGVLPGSGRIKNGREMYDQGRFFTFTGEVFGEHKEVIKKQATLERFYLEWFGESYESKKAGSLEWDDSAEISELESLDIDDATKALITDGSGMEGYKNDRSNALYFVTKTLVAAGANKETILNILTDSRYFLAGAAIDRRGDGEGAKQWLWNYTVGKLFAEFEAVREEFEGVSQVEKSGTAEPEKIAYSKNYEQNAVRFLKKFRLIRHQREFFAYNGKFWKIEDDEMVEGDVQKTALGQGVSMNVINSTIKAVKRLSTKKNLKPHQNFIAFNNGVLDLSNWKMGTFSDLLPHDPKHFTTSLLNFSYDTKATCPHWLRFLDQALEQKDQQKLMQEWMGYCLVFSYAYQKIMVMMGRSRSGKGVIAQIMREMVGGDAFCGQSLTSMTTQFGLQQMVHAKVAVIGDAHRAPKNSIEQAKEKLLNISGQDHLLIDRKNCPAISVQVPARLTIQANQMPRFMDESNALVNRYLVLKFEKSFAGKEDPFLLDKLREELPGIFNWALQGLIRLAQQGGFTETALGEVTKLHLLEGNNPIGGFVRRYCVIEEGAEVSKRELFDAYEEFARHNEYWAMTIHRFSLELKSQFPEIEEGRTGRDAHGQRHRAWGGITLKKNTFELLHGDFDAV